MKYNVWYMRPKWFPHGILGMKPDPIHLGETHAYIKSIETDTLDNVFILMQGENWPEADLSLIDGVRVGHTSMSVGDVAVAAPTGKGWMAETIGWFDLGQIK